jgi:hypothetical protein
MAFDQRGLDDYVDVAARIAEFRARHPHGWLAPLNPVEPYKLVQAQGFEKNGDVVTQTFVVVVAGAFREPGDREPGVGMAWEVFPGRTPYTRGSELMNAETSAWGRAIIAVGAADARKGIASQEEVRNRQAERDDGLPVNRDGSLSRSRTTDEQKAAAGVMTSTQQAEHSKLRKLDHPRPAERSTGPQTEATEWETPLEGRENEPGTSSYPQQRKIAMVLGELGITDRAEKLRVCSDAAGRPIGSSKELSWSEAEAIIAHAAELASKEKAGAS